MSDTISRRAALDALGDEPEVWTGKDEYAQGLNNQWHYDRNAIKALPTVDAVPVVHGRWIIKDNPGTGWYRVTCSYCGEDVTSTIPMIGFFPNCKALWDYCPNCGTRMDGKDGERQNEKG